MKITTKFNLLDEVYAIIGFSIESFKIEEIFVRYSLETPNGGIQATREEIIYLDEFGREYLEDELFLSVEDAKERMIKLIKEM